MISGGSEIMAIAGKEEEEILTIVDEAINKNL
jgi:hypothetical protein